MKICKRVCTIYCLLYFFTVFFISSCSVEYPYLILFVEQEYSSSSISIPYSFKSESDPQSCSVTLIKLDGSGDIIYNNRDQETENNELKLPCEGVLYFNNLKDGRYNLCFTVLSDKGGSLAELPFLDQESEFIINTSGG